MDQIEVVGHAIGAGIHGHGRDHHAVQLARRAGVRTIATVAADDIPFVRNLGADTVIDFQTQRFEEEVRDADAVIDLVGGETQTRSFQVLRRGGKLISAVSRPDPHLARTHGVDAAFFLVELQRPRHIGLLRQRARQGDSIFHRQLGARPDGEVRGVRRVADEHHVTVMPLFAQHAIEVEPRRPAQVARVAHQAMPVQILAEHFLAKSDRCFPVRPIQPCREPGLLARLDDECAGVSIETVGVKLEPAPGRLLERKGERIQQAMRAEPDVSALAHVDIGLKVLGVLASQDAVGTVRSDDHAASVNDPSSVTRSRTPASLPASGARACRMLSSLPSDARTVAADDLRPLKKTSMSSQ